MSAPKSRSAARARRLAPLVSSLLLVASAGTGLILQGCYTGTQNGTGTVASASGAPPVVQASNGWFAISLGGASGARMPKSPTTRSESIRLADGARLTTRSYAAQYGQAGCLAVVSEFEGGVPGDPVDTAERVLENFLDDLEGFETVSADAVVRAGFPGTLLELRNESDRRVLRVQVFAGRARVYVFASFKTGNPDARIERIETDFFQSVRLDPADAPSPDGSGALDFAAFVTIQPPEAGIAVDLPGAVRRESGTVELGDETARVFEYWTASTDRLTSMKARVFHFDRAPRDILDRLREIARNGEGTAGPTRPAQRQGFGGQAYTIETETQTRYVIDLVLPRGAIQLIHSVPRGDEQVQAEQRRRFLNSLRIF